MTYRYICNGTATPDMPVSDFRLVSKTAIATQTEALRVHVPANMSLTNYPYDGYAVTNDSRTLSELNCVPVVKINRRWHKMPELAAHPIHKWHEELAKQGIFSVTDHAIGYLVKSDYEAYLNQLKSQTNIITRNKTIIEIAVSKDDGDVLQHDVTSLNAEQVITKAKADNKGKSMAFCKFNVSDIACASQIANLTANLFGDMSGCLSFTVRNTLAVQILTNAFINCGFELEA